jgi:DivIVA domain-containing protein
MEFGIWILAVVVLGIAAFAAAGRFGEMPATVTDTPHPQLPVGQLTSMDLRAVRFAVVPRGYSMQQVDELLDRLATQLGSANATNAEQSGWYSTPEPRSTSEEGSSARRWAVDESADRSLDPD